ncbi:hypothetical protein GCM10009019_17840 [Salarchaeum japonicum]|uniref:Uncharacterized protein n=1 Tax=Salarchaeum japonicum TaxID=555573 RepID=A0AAV3T490_9EURY
MRVAVCCAVAPGALGFAVRDAADAAATPPVNAPATTVTARSAARTLRVFLITTRHAMDGFLKGLRAEK